ncbi:MAG: WG repeat-containing protein [Melioribacteraceae bacterium]|nr:WG repeat-containing protein [Melioribacteraceae bacterium]
MKELKFIHGEYIDGTSVVYEKTGYGILKSLLFEDGSSYSLHRYSCVGNFRDGLAWYELNGWMGYINRKGLEIIEAKYDLANDFSEGRAFITYAKKGMLIDDNGVQLSYLPSVEFNSEFNEGLARVGIFSEDFNSRIDGFVGRYGEIVIPMKYSKRIFSPLDLIDENDYFNEGLARIAIEGKYGFIDKTGAIIIDCIYDWVSKFDFGMAVAIKSGKAGIINQRGEPIIDFDFMDVKIIAEDKLYAKNEFGWYLLDFMNEQNSDTTQYYQDVKKINENLTAIKKNNKWGVIDRNGKLLLPHLSVTTPNFEEGLLKYKTRREFIIRNREGKELRWKPELHGGDFFNITNF